MLVNLYAQAYECFITKQLINFSSQFAKLEVKKWLKRNPLFTMKWIWTYLLVAQVGFHSTHGNSGQSPHSGTSQAVD